MLRFGRTYGDVFSRNTHFFDDPFFNDPFEDEISEMMLRAFGGLLGEPNRDRSSRDHHRGIIVEEVDDNGVPIQSSRESSYEFPRTQRSLMNAINQSTNLNFDLESNRNSHYSSSYTSTVYSSSSSGGQPVYIEKTKTTRRGPGGVAEQHESLRDSRSGVERLTIQRKLGDKQRTLTKQRTRDGQVLTSENLQNVEVEEADLFDDQWMRAAERNLKGYGTPRSVSNRTEEARAAPLTIEAPSSIASRRARREAAALEREAARRERSRNIATPEYVPDYRRRP